MSPVGKAWFILLLNRLLRPHLNREPESQRGQNRIHRRPSGIAFAGQCAVEVLAVQASLLGQGADAAAGFDYGAQGQEKGLLVAVSFVLFQGDGKVEARV